MVQIPESNLMGSQTYPIRQKHPENIEKGCILRRKFKYTDGNTANLTYMRTSPLSVFP